MSELQSSLHEYLEEQEQTQNEGFTVDTDEKANWALRKIKQAKQKQEESNALTLSEIDKVERWNKKQQEDAQMDIDFFQGLLAGYASKKREEDPKYKSQKLPNGRIRFKKQQPKYVYDDAALLTSLKKNGRNDLVKVKETVDKTEVKKAFVSQNGALIDPDTGEFIDGVTVVDQEDKFEVITDEQE